MHPDATSLAIWADALCIDQSNNEEKSHQVCQMHRVYSGAVLTIVWLGPENDGSGQAIDLIERFQAEDFSNDDLMFDAMRESLLDPGNTEAWKAIFALLHRPWFTRLWVVQELMASQHVYLLCGHLMLPFKELNRFLIVCEGTFLLRLRSVDMLTSELRPFYLTSRIQLSTIIMLFWLKTGGLEGDTAAYAVNPAATLYTLLDRTTRRCCADPRDRLYALVGIANRNSSSPDTALIPDYTKPVGLIWKELFISYVQTAGSLSPLSYAKQEVQTGSPLPTWTPRFEWHREAGEIDDNKKTHSFILKAAAASMSALMSEGGNEQQVASATMHTPAHASFSGGSSKLNVRGFAVGIIESVDSNVHQERFWRSEHYRDLILNWSHFLTARDRQISRSAEPGDKSITDAFWRTLVQDWDRDGGPMRPEAKEIFLSVLESEREWAAHPGYSTMEFLSSVRRTCHSRQIYAMDDGRFGLGPQAFQLGEFGVRSGDVICVIFGGPVPYVLRPVGDGKFMFIGETYVHAGLCGERRSRI